MQAINFLKYQGTGNDFILLDGRVQDFSFLNVEIIARLCDRHFGIGADGLIILTTHPEYAYQMIYYNSDGRESSMCGNGGRCFVKFAAELGLIQESIQFLAIDGLHEAVIEADQNVSLKMTDVSNIEKSAAGMFLQTGSPHWVMQADHINELDLIPFARSIRYSDRWKSSGVNVNVVEFKTSEPLGLIKMRTYERGVENETLSCGTGAVAAALAYREWTAYDDSVRLETPGGILQVKAEKTSAGYRNIWLSGPAEKVFEGIIRL